MDHGPPAVFFIGKTIDVSRAYRQAYGHDIQNISSTIGDATA
jgi:hypothetical protein